MANQTGATLIDASGTTLAIYQLDSFGREGADNDSLHWRNRMWNYELINPMGISLKKSAPEGMIKIILF